MQRAPAPGSGEPKHPRRCGQCTEQVVQSLQRALLMLGGHALEVLAAQRELAVAVGVHDEAHHVRHRQPLRALAIALPAHTAEVRADFLQTRYQNLGVVVGEALATWS